MSVYVGMMDKKSFEKAMLRLKIAFPNITKEFLTLLFDRFVSRGFSNERVKDSVDYLIDNYKYPTPTIAEIISYDAKVRLLTYDQVMKIHNEIGKAFDMYSAVVIEGIKTKVWASNFDIEKYKLKKLKP